MTGDWTPEEKAFRIEDDGTFEVNNSVDDQVVDSWWKRIYLRLFRRYTR